MVELEGVEPSRTTVQRSPADPQRNPLSRLRRSRTSVSRASTGRLRRVSYQSLETSAGVEPACAALQAAGWPLSHLAGWIGEKDSNPHCLVQSEVACRFSGSPKEIVHAPPRDARAFHSSSYLPAVGHPPRWGCLVPLGSASTSQAAPGFPECPGEDSNLPAPSWRACKYGVTYRRHAAAHRYDTIPAEADVFMFRIRLAHSPEPLNDEGRPGNPESPSARTCIQSGLAEDARILPVALHRGARKRGRPVQRMGFGCPAD